MWLDSHSKVEMKVAEPELHGTDASEVRLATMQRRLMTTTFIILSTLILIVVVVSFSGIFGILTLVRFWHPDQQHLQYLTETLHPLLLETTLDNAPVQSPYGSKSKGPFSSLRGPHITSNFPDPCVIYHDGTTYAFGTNNRKIGPEHVHVQVAESTNNKTWTLQPHLDALPNVGPWQSGRAMWAPDVKHLPNDKFLMYYTDSLANDLEKHCIGAAVSSNITGPYNPYSKPLICPHGGAIDPAGFFDRSTGKRYIIYKVDGNSLGHGGSCRNDVLPIVPTPLMLQEVDPHDGITLIGSPTKLLDRDALDGPLIEAPAMYLSTEDVYFLFFSSNCFTTPLYHTTYATARNITGPYRRAARPLLATGDAALGLVGPGGLDIIHHTYATAWNESLQGVSELKKKKHKHKRGEEGHLVVFHGELTYHNMPTRKDGVQRPIQDIHSFVRGMYSGTVCLRGTSATLQSGRC